MPTVELVYDRGCPNVAEARAALARALDEAGLPPGWTEHVSDDPDCPAHARGWGSPTILVDGRDVGGEAPGRDQCCRLYGGGGIGLARVPAVPEVTAALRGAAATRASLR